MMLAAIAACAVAASVHAMPTKIDLGDYHLSATHALPPVAASEASAVTWNWDTGTLFVLGDEGDAIVEVSTTGRQLSVMSLTNFQDTEALTYIGNGQFVMGEERTQDLFQLAYTPGATVDINDLDAVSIGPTVGNIGLEGVSYDPLTGQLITVKEKLPQLILSVDADFSDETATIEELFDPSTLALLDLSDVQALSTVPSLAGTPDGENLLIFSQESRMLLEVGRDGTIHSFFDFAAITADAEGVTIAPDGTIYIVGEAPALYVLSPNIPTPGTLAPLAGALALITTRRRRRQR